MLETLYSQLRFAASVALGIPFNLRSMDRLIEATQETQREFGSIGSEASELLEGPTLDDETRREIHARRFRKQAIRAAAETPYYQRLFAQMGLNPCKLRYQDISKVPPTPKEAIRDDPDAFVRRTAVPCFPTTTTGTTGRPTSVCFSRHEMRMYAALAALTFLTTGQIRQDDIVQINSSSRATLGNTCFGAACMRLGALVYLAGLVEPSLSLDLLMEERRLPGKRDRTSVLLAYPSYLGQLVECGLGRGLGPGNFGLRRIVAGGELVTGAMKHRARRLFGDVEFGEGYGMTETWPVTGSVCSQGHLHFEPSQGLIECVDPESGQPVEGDQAGSLIITPFAPYRQTTIVLRCDTRDAARRIPLPLTCSLKHQPGAVGNLLGKVRLAVRHDAGWTFPRDVLDAVEAVEELPLPGRCGLHAIAGGVAVDVLARSDAPSLRRKIENSLAERGVPVAELRLVSDVRELRGPIPFRCDLRETSFAFTQPEQGT